jgi:methionyl aminopeptidase
MAIIVKSGVEIERMKQAGRVTFEALEVLRKMIRAGVTTAELDQAAADYIRSKGGVPSSLGYRGFPRSVCISVNEEVIHGIPGKRRIQNGDIVSVDLNAYVNGFHGDAARTFMVGEVSGEAKRLVEVTERCFWEAVKFAKHGRHLHEICGAIQEYAEGAGFSVVRDYCGHGIGKAFHEDPSIPCFKPPGRGPRLARGMTLAVEPMINAGLAETAVLNDKWTVVTKDGKLSAHYENTVLVTDGEADILTIN